MLMANTISISKARLLTTGVDGGHCYLAGLCVWDSRIVPVYAFMLDKAEEQQLLRQHDGTARLQYGRSSYIHRIGLSLWDCRVVSDE
jgi:hypothetical protein